MGRLSRGSPLVACSRRRVQFLATAGRRSSADTPVITLVAPDRVAGPRITPDAEQQRAVDHAATPGAGPLLILAGPGTGKTATLVEAVAARIEAGTPADRILVLTFSRKAAQELRDRIATRLGPDQLGATAWTFHAFCFALVGDATQDFEWGAPRRTLLTNPEQDAVIRELLQGHVEDDAPTVQWPKQWQAALTTAGFAAEIRTVFQRARTLGLEPHELMAIAQQQGRYAWVSVADALSEYLDVLDHKNEIDYTEMVTRAVIFAQSSRGQADLRQRYDAVFVDEFQDTDPAQERLLQAIAGGGRDLIAVGDPDQSIYAFRGADVKGIVEFPVRFPQADGSEAAVVALRTCRRSGEGLVNLAVSVAAKFSSTGTAFKGDGRSHRQRVAAPDLPTSVIDVHTYSSTIAQGDAIADQLRRAHLDDGIAWSQMAVLVRSGARSIPSLHRSLHAAGVPVEVAGEDLPLHLDPAVEPLLTAMRCVIEPASVTADEIRALLLSAYCGGDSAQLRRLGRALREESRQANEFGLPTTSSGELIRDAVLTPGLLATHDEEVTGVARRLSEVIVLARQAMATHDDPHEVLWTLWDQQPWRNDDVRTWGQRLERSSYSGGAQGRRADRHLDAVLTLFTLAMRNRERSAAGGARGFLHNITRQSIPADTLVQRGVSRDAVRVMSAHRSKGLEWDFVVVADVQADVWPDMRQRGTLLQADQLVAHDIEDVHPLTTTLAEERRLFYVAITRARQRLLVTAVGEASENGSQPSRFIDELIRSNPTLSATAITARTPRPSTLPGLVASLRAQLLNDGLSKAERDIAIQILGSLASEKVGEELLVPTAHPDNWWGVREISGEDVHPFPPEKQIRLSGSQLESLVTCPLSWYLGRAVRANGPRNAAMGFGSVVHALAEEAASQDVTPHIDELMVHLDRVWDEVSYDAVWQADVERGKARDALINFLSWQAANERRLIGAEESFAMDVTIAGRNVHLSGKIDRLELTAEGKVVVIDLKTMKSAPSKDSTQENPQLGLYQLAVREGALNDAIAQFRELPSPDEEITGGAELVLLRLTSRGKTTVREQSALVADEASSATWMGELLEEGVAQIASGAFPPIVNDACTFCDFKTACPTTDEGKGVIA